MNHWTLISIDMQNEEITHYNSFLQQNLRNKKAVNIKFEFAKYFLTFEAKITKFSTWRCKEITNLPQQSNDYDCGMFICAFARSICNNISDKSINFNFSQSNMPHFRSLMFNEIMKMELITDDATNQIFDAKH